MKVTLKMFAILRERSGVSQVEIELADGATVAMALNDVGHRYAGLANLLPRIAVAVNRSYAKPAYVLHDGDELALIPPVSGG